MDEISQTDVHHKAEWMDVWNCPAVPEDILQPVVTSSGYRGTKSNIIPSTTFVMLRKCLQVLKVKTLKMTYGLFKEVIIMFYVTASITGDIWEQDN